MTADQPPADVLTVREVAAILKCSRMFDLAELRARLDRYTIPEPNSGCHLFLGVIGAFGYGYLKVAGRQRFAHRVSFVLAGKHIPDGYVLDHLCRTKSCVNPDHLEAVTNRENVLRGVGFAARHARVVACPSGHPYDERNTYRSKAGERHCRLCRKDAERSRRARKRAVLGPQPIKTRGEGNGRAKLTAERVVAIRNRNAAGERKVDLAAEFGVSDTVISAIVARRSWRHVP